MEYQTRNATLAINAVKLLDRDIALDTIKTGLMNTVWSGRMELMAERTYIDGAHNIDGIEAFVQTVRDMEIDDEGRCFLIFSSVRDKRYEEMIQKLCTLPMVTDFVITQIPGERGTDIAELNRNFSLYTEKCIHSFEDIADLRGDMF